MLESASRRGSAWSRGGLPGLGGCLPALGGWGVCLLWGGCLPGPGGVCLIQGVSTWSGGGMASQHALRQTPSPPCGQTHTCKNITLTTTSLRPVIILGRNSLQMCRWFVMTNVWLVPNALVPSNQNFTLLMVIWTYPTINSTIQWAVSLLQISNGHSFIDKDQYFNFHNNLFWQHFFPGP